VGVCTGKVGRLLAFKDATDVVASAPEVVDEIRPVGHQPAAAKKRFG
jgi:hypothetical protein